MTTTAAPRAEEVLPGVFRLDCPFGEGGIVFVYYIDAPEPALVDTGINRSPGEVIEPGLRAVGKSLSDVRHLLNTHGHWDHMGGNEAVRKHAPDAKTYINAADTHLLQSASAHYNGYSSYAARLLHDRAAHGWVEQMQGASIDCPTPADVLVEDDQVISVGGSDRVRVVRTPGHSDGSTSYLLEGRGILFTGDGVQGLGSRPGQLPLIFDDTQAYRATIAKLAGMRLDALCTGHAFCGLPPASGRDPVRKGAAAKLYLEESGEAAKAVEEAARSILGDRQNAPFDEFARALFGRLEKPLGLVLDSA
ncbi:MAG TPA: MBL fold metallo-hydrolase, partial [Chloroflexota bacterium]|nr:MBL fold metallo-hydrolase [Chloroflexota bacterium]